MTEMMKLAIDVLKDKISSNLDEIKTNEQKFRKIMSHGEINDNTEIMNSLLDSSKKLLSQNLDFLNLQLSMLKFLEKYRDHENDYANISLEDIDKIHESIDVFFFTTQGSLPFNAVHPLVYDEYFWGELLHYYEINAQPKEVKQVLSTIMMSKLN